VEAEVEIANQEIVEQEPVDRTVVAEEEAVVEQTLLHHLPLEDHTGTHIHPEIIG
jgi:hypothetical protein